MCSLTSPPEAKLGETSQKGIDVQTLLMFVGIYAGGQGITGYVQGSTVEDVSAKSTKALVTQLQETNEKLDTVTEVMQDVAQYCDGEGALSKLVEMLKKKEP